MAMERVFECPETIIKLRSGPLRELLDGFCEWLINQQYNRVLIRRHLRNVGHLNSFLGGANAATRQQLTAHDVASFLRRFPSYYKNLGSGKDPLREVRYAIRRFTKYLEIHGRFDRLVPPPHYQPLLNSYLEWMRQRQHAAEGTVQVRARSIKHFLKWLGPQVTVGRLGILTAGHIEQFLMEYSQGTGQGGLHSMQSALRTFMRFGLHTGLIREQLDLAVPTLRTYKLATVPRGLSTEQACQVLAAVDKSQSVGRRDYAILQLLHTYGVRGGQIRALRLNDIEWARNRIRFHALKHGKDSLLPLTAEVGSSLLDYLQNARPTSAWPEVFLTCRPPYHPLPDSGTLSSITCQRIKNAGIDVPCRGAHVFRHEFASRMVNEGHSLKAISDVLGHRYLSTTFLYTKVDFAALRQVALEWPQEGIT